MSDMKTYLEQNAYEPESIITRSVADPKSWDEVASTIKSAIFDYLELHPDMLNCTEYLYVGIEALWDDPYEEAERFHLAIPTTTIKHSFISMLTRDFDEVFLIPNAKRLIMMLQKAGFDEPTMSSGVTVFVAEIKRQELTPPKASMPNWTYCDQALPRPNERLLLLVVELDHGQKPSDPNAKRCYDTDFGSYHPDKSGFYGAWSTDNDWDEGQPWAVVAWTSIPTIDPAEVAKHKVDWYNAEAK